MIDITGVDQDPERGLLAHYRLNVGCQIKFWRVSTAPITIEAHTSRGMSCSLVDRRSWRIAGFDYAGGPYLYSTVLMQGQTRIVTCGARIDELIGDGDLGTPETAHGAQIMEQE